MLWALITAVVSAAPAQQLAVTRFKLVQVDPSLGGYAEDRLAAHLAERGFVVRTAADIETMLGMERQRELLGCGSESCLAEISAALGVPLVASGRLTRLGTRLELDVRVISQHDGKVVATASEATDDEARLGELVKRAANAVADQLGQGAATPAAPFRWRLWVPTGLGVVSLGIGAFFVIGAELEYSSWTSPGGTMDPLVDGAITTRFEALSARRGVGFGLGALGAALIATGIVWNALTPDAPVTVSAALGPQGGALVIGGRF